MYQKQKPQRDLGSAMRFGISVGLGEKKHEKTVSLILAVMMLVAVFPMFSTPDSAAGYDAGAAVAWASDRNAHNSVSNLVFSQHVCKCLQAGGLKIPYENHSQYPNRISSWVVGNGYGKIMDVSDSAIKKMKAGDVILVMCSGHESKYAYGMPRSSLNLLLSSYGTVSTAIYRKR